jgi:hypothetical protein
MEMLGNVINQNNETMIIKCPKTGKVYERFNSDLYHSQDCPFGCKLNKDKIKKQKI